MGTAQSFIVSSLTVCSVCFLYVHIYLSHMALKRSVLDDHSLPSSVFLYIKYLIRILTRRRGHLYSESKQSEVDYTALNCRLQVPLLRRFCSAAGYGWDYPDTDYRDTPLCFPEFLCRRLLLMVLTDGKFRLSPAGLVRVRQSLKTLEPVDELKKGVFMLRVRVLEYRQLDAGVEVDVCLSATSRTGRLVWESVLTLLSERKEHKVGRCLLKNENQSQQDEPVLENVKQVDLPVPKTAALQGVWSFSDSSPFRLLFLLAWLLGRMQTSPSLWMLSVCLAEIEKHKGVGVITAPVSITAQFTEPLWTPGRVTLRFWDSTESIGGPGRPGDPGGPSSARGVRFQMQHHERNTCHVMGLISKC